jgi:GABA permease
MWLAATSGNVRVMDRKAGSTLGRALSAVSRRLGGKTVLVLFALGGGALYLTAVLVVTLGLGGGLPLLGWVGFAVFLVRSSLGAGSEPPQRRPIGRPGLHRVLVVADEGCLGAALCRPLAGRLQGRRAEVLVVAPALVSATHYLDSDVDAAREAAQGRLAETLAALEATGITARGEVGSESPLEAIAEALAVFAADEIVVVTPPPERTNWLEQDVVERAGELYDQPVVHLLIEAPLHVEIRPR